MNELIWFGTGQVGYLCVNCVFAIVVPGFELELLNSGVELFEGPLAIFCFGNLCAQ